MISKKDQLIYENIDFLLRESIPVLSKNIYNSLNEWTLAQKIGLMGKEIHSKILDTAHRLNLASNFSAKQNSQRIRDELLTAHYSRELGMSHRNIKNIMALPPSHPERISLKAKIRTLGTANPNIGDLQKSADNTIQNFSQKIGRSYAVLRSPRSPARMAAIYRFIRKNPGIRNIP